MITSSVYQGTIAYARKNWECLTSVGINDTISKEETKYVRFTNVVTVITAFAVFAYIPNSLISGHYFLAALQAFDVMCVLVPMWLNSKGHNKLARHSYILVINGFVLINSVLIGYESRVHEFFYISFVVPFLLFSARDYKNIVVGALTAVLFFVLYRNIYPNFTQYNLPLADQLAFETMNVWMKFLLFGIAIYIMAHYNYTSERQLATINEKLEEQAVELKRSNADLEQFGYIISHDLKAPVRNISSFMKILLTRSEQAGLTPDINEFIRLSKESADRLAKQIDDFLSYCRVDRNLPPTSDVDVNATVKTIQMELSEKIKERNATIVVEGTLPLLQGVHGTMVHHIFQNLIANAVKFNTTGSPLVKIGYSIVNGQSVFYVSDNGIGIDPGFEKKLFQMFKRLHTNEQFDGTGIGLALTKKIVTFYGGQIWYQSQKGSGTTFYFTLPRHLANAVKPKKHETTYSAPLQMVTEAA